MSKGQRVNCCENQRRETSTASQFYGYTDGEQTAEGEKGGGREFGRVSSAKKMSNSERELDDGRGGKNQDER